MQRDSEICSESHLQVVPQAGPVWCGVGGLAAAAAARVYRAIMMRMTASVLMPVDGIFEAGKSNAPAAVPHLLQGEVRTSS